MVSIVTDQPFNWEYSNLTIQLLDCGYHESKSRTVAHPPPCSLQLCDSLDVKKNTLYHSLVSINPPPHEKTHSLFVSLTILDPKLLCNTAIKHPIWLHSKYMFPRKHGPFLQTICVSKCISNLF